MSTLNPDQKLKALDIATNLAIFYAQGIKIFESYETRAENGNEKLPLIPLGSELKIKDEIQFVDQYIDFFYNYVSEKIQKLN